MRACLFDLPMDVLFHAIKYLVMEDVGKLDIAVSEKDSRQVFLNILRNRLISFKYTSTDNAEKSISWIAARGVRVRNFALEFEDLKIPSPPSLSSLEASNFELLEDLSLRNYFDPDFAGGTRMALVALFVNKINQSCRSLRSVIVTHCHLQQDGILEMLALNPTILKLELHICQGRFVLLQDILRHCKHLKTFEFYNFLGTLGPAPPANTVMTTLSSLTSVTIDFGFEPADLLFFYDEHLRYIADIAPNIRELTIAKASELTTEAYQYLANKCTQVVNLDLQQYDEQRQSAHFNLPRAIANFFRPQLRFLCLSIRTDAEEIGELARLIDERGQSLKKVTLGFSDERCAPIVAAIIRRCVGLKSLHLEGESAANFFAGVIEGIDPVLRSGLTNFHSEDALTLSQLASISVHLPALSSLFITPRPGESLVHVATILTSCTKLKAFTVQSHDTPTMAALNAADMGALAAMKPTKLQQLALSIRGLDSIFAQLMLSRCPLLQTLWLHCCLLTGILDDNLAQIISTQCPLLRKLRVRNVVTLTRDDVLRMFALVPQVINYFIDIKHTGVEHRKMLQAICRSTVAPPGKTFGFLFNQRGSR